MLVVDEDGTPLCLRCGQPRHHLGIPCDPAKVAELDAHRQEAMREVLAESAARPCRGRQRRYTDDEVDDIIHRANDEWC